MKIVDQSKEHMLKGRDINSYCLVLIMRGPQQSPHVRPLHNHRSWRRTVIRRKSDSIPDECGVAVDECVCDRATDIIQDLRAFEVTTTGHIDRTLGGEVNEVACTFTKAAKRFKYERIEFRSF